MNRMKIEFDSKLENEAFARTAGIAFLMPYHLSMDEIMEIKTILAEAIVNCMIHGYEKKQGRITLIMEVDDERVVAITVIDEGKGIEDIALAMQPMYTTRQDLERSGMGMTIMENFADEFYVQSKVNEGTKVVCKKKLGNYE